MRSLILMRNTSAAVIFRRRVPDGALFTLGLTGRGYSPVCRRIAIPILVPADSSPDASLSQSLLLDAGSHIIPGREHTCVIAPPPDGDGQIWNTLHRDCTHYSRRHIQADSTPTPKCDESDAPRANSLRQPPQESALIPDGPHIYTVAADKMMGN